MYICVCVCGILMRCNNLQYINVSSMNNCLLKRVVLVICFNMQVTPSTNLTNFFEITCFVLN